MDGLKIFFNDIVVPFAGGLKANFAYLLKRWPQETTAAIVILAVFFAMLAALRKSRNTGARLKEAQEKKLNKGFGLVMLLLLIGLLIAGSFTFAK